MNKINAVIVDDEVKGRELIRVLLNQYCTRVNVIGTANSVEQGYDQIMSLKPDLVFLDIEMPDGTGFDLLEKFREINFAIIFVTAYDKYAIRAIKFSAIDYLLKPLSEDELVSAVKKVQKKETGGTKSKIKGLNENYKNAQNGVNKLAISTQNGLFLVEIADIVRLRAVGNYTKVHLKEKKELIAARSLGEFEDFLKDFNFVRVHNSHIINPGFVVSYQRGRGGIVKMIDGAEIDVSQRKKHEFLNGLHKI